MDFRTTAKLIDTCNEPATLCRGRPTKVGELADAEAGEDERGDDGQPSQPGSTSSSAAGSRTATICSAVWSGAPADLRLPTAGLSSVHPCSKAKERSQRLRSPRCCDLAFRVPPLVVPRQRRKSGSREQDPAPGTWSAVAWQAKRIRMRPLLDPRSPVDAEIAHWRTRGRPLGRGLFPWTCSQPGSARRCHICDPIWTCR